MSIPADKQHEARDLPAKSADHLNERLHQNVHEARLGANQGLGPSASEIKQANQWFSHDSSHAAHVGEQAFPNLSVADAKEKFQSALLDPKASSQEKLQLAESLAAHGVKEMRAKGADGAMHKLRLEKEGVGHGRSMVHVFDENGNGKERPILRGIDNGNGSFSREQDRHGHAVTFEQGVGRASANQPSAEQPHAAPTEQQRHGGEGRQSPQQGRREYHHGDAHGQHHYGEGGNEGGDGGQSRSHPGEVQQPQSSGDANSRRPDKPSDTSGGNSSPFRGSDAPRGENGTDNTNSRQSSGAVNPNNLSQADLNDMFDRARAGANTHGAPVYFQAKMDIDADGSPRARQIDPCGQTRTSLRDEHGQSVNAEKVPYIVLPAGRYQGHDIHLGDVAAVRYHGKVAFAQFADVGPSHKLGEGSMALARQLGMSDSPTHGGTQRREVEYMVFPRSRTGAPQDVSLADAQGVRLLAHHSGYELADSNY